MLAQLKERDHIRFNVALAIYSGHWPDQLNAVTIIAVTASVLGEETAQFIAEAADFMLLKPISRQSLIT